MIERNLAAIVTSSEQERAQGNLDRVLKLVRGNSKINPPEIINLPHEQLVSLMQLWRIWTVSLMSLAGKKWNGDKAAELLLEARGVFLRYYEHPFVQEVASKMRNDPSGAEYQMLPEMNRDEGKWWETWARLTGRPEYLERAIGCYNEAIRAATEGSSAWGVATMEREIAERQRGGKINWDVFSFAYRKVVELAPQAGGWDRKAAVSWWYIREAILAGRRKEIKEGLTNLQNACQEGKIPWIKYPLTEIIQLILSTVRRATYTGHKDPDLAASTTRA
jgi:hypothetical protein